MSAGLFQNLLMDNLPLARSGRSALEVATQAAKEAGNIVLAHFRSTQKIERKGQGNLVTEADILSEKLILKFLKDEYPSHDVLSEESNFSTLVSGYAWIVDPLDGTNNYAFGIPFLCINIALVKDADILLGVTYDPLRDELFRAEKGCGAYLNDLAIQVSKVDSLRHSIVGFDLGYNSERGSEILDIASKLWGQVHCLRMIGSASLGLAYVACGWFNLYFHRWLYPWDIAAGLLLIREAGGTVVDWQGKPATFQAKEVIASNRKICHEFVERFV